MSELPVRRDADEPSIESTEPTADGMLVPSVVGADDAADAYAAVVVTYDDAPDECTVFPVEVSEADLVTTWVSAREGSFVPLAEMR